MRHRKNQALPVTDAETPNIAFKPKLYRYANNMAGGACHVLGYALQFGLTQALGGKEAAMRVLLHAVWGIVIFLVVMGLTTLMVASTLDSAVSPEQLGYLVGRKIFWLLGGTGLILFVCSRRGWLPGLQQPGPAA